MTWPLNRLIGKNKERQDQINGAEEAGDATKVRELMSKQVDPPKQIDRPDPTAVYLENWRKESTWYDKNREMRETFQGEYEATVKRSIRAGKGIPYAGDIVPGIEQKMHRYYPEEFASPENHNANRGSGAEKDGGKKTVKTKGLQRSDLTEVESLHFQQYLDDGMKEPDLLASIQTLREQNG